MAGEAGQDWRDRWTLWRNRVLANRGFQRWAARFPLTRPVARSRARGLFDLVAGFVYTQVAFAGVQLGLFRLLEAGPKSVEQVAAATDLPIEGAERLLLASASLGLTQQLRSGHYTLGQTGAALVGNGGIADMIAHHAHLYADLADPVSLLRRGGGGKLSGYWPYAQGAGATDGSGVAGYSALMAASQPLVAEQVLDAHDFSCYHKLLDVGGGEGAFLQAVAARHPALSLMLFDLPAVAARAQARLGPMLEAIGGSFCEDALPQGADIITLVRVLHDHDDDVVMQLLKKVRTALPPGGTLLVAEPMAGTRGAEPVGEAYFGFYLLAMGSGRPRTAEALSGMLRAAGFSGVRQIPTALPLSARVLVGKA